MKNAKISRRSFLKAGAVASAVGMLSAAPVAAHAAETDASAAADEENGLLDVFKKPKYVFLFIGDGMGTAQIQSARFYKGTVDNNGAVTEADLSFTSFPQVGSVEHKAGEILYSGEGERRRRGSSWSYKTNPF